MTNRKVSFDAARIAHIPTDHITMVGMHLSPTPWSAIGKTLRTAAGGGGHAGGITRRLLVVVLALLAATDTSAQTAGVTATRVAAGSIVLDGRLNEPVWQQAGVIENLVQQNPHPGVPTPYRTEVRVLADAQHLYFGFTCIDPNPATIAVHTLERDSDQTNDDHITIVLDPFGGGRLGYWFQVNAGGARADGLDVNDSTDSNWNGVWNAAVQRTRIGWTVEVMISTQSLQFPSALVAWRLNVQRAVPRDLLSVRWAGITLNSDIYDLHRAGKLAGVSGLEQGLGLDVQPYVLGRYNSASGAARTGDVGVDVKYNFTPQLAGILTINPDFAEAEAEQGQVNLTRFSVFFPEKRPFFLEGSNRFNFGNDLNIGNDGNLSTQFVPYFSRRIGLVDGHIVPIDEGAKFVGRAGKYSIGALDVETGDSAFAPATNLGVARAAYDVNDNLHVGTMLTHGDPTGGTDNTFAGFDSVWHTSHFAGNRNLTLSGWYGHSYGDLMPGSAAGYGGSISYPNDLLLGRLRINQFGEAFNPALGFLPRPGTRQYLGTLVYKPRPEKGLFDWVRQFFIGGTYIQVDDLDGHPQSKLLLLVPSGIHADSGYSVQPEINDEYEALDAPFTVAPGVTIPIGRYRFKQYLISGSTPESWPWSVSANVLTGHFYTGTTRQESIALNWTAPAGKLQLGISNENDFGYLPQGDFIIRLTKLNVAYSFTPDLSLASFAQYDSITRATGVNTRLRWIIQPGCDLFVVFNHGIQPQLANLNRAPPTGNAFIVKLRWDFHW